MKLPIENDWLPIIEQATDRPSYQKLREFLKNEYSNETVYPKMDEIWTAFEWTPYEKVKAVIIGQDPYHGPDQAHGLSFSVKKKVSIPPSLRNIYKELEDDIGVQAPDHGYLKSWADQGVLMLNSVLTVRAGQAHSHQGKGWEELTDFVIEKLNEKDDPVVFILWGNPAKKKGEKIDPNKHFIISSVHPSPLSAYRGFFGSKPFSKTNEALEKAGISPINWAIDD